MKITGTTTEYNPFHNGHRYHLEQVREAAGSDAVVVAMSGNYVQRGEAAILDKWTRARHALECGADLVVEIPVMFCLSNAGAYAAASVSILEALGCSGIAFGSECGNISLLKRVADNLKRHSDVLGDVETEYKKQGYSFPAARCAAYRKLFSGSDSLDEELGILSSPNDILALEYIKACTSASPLAIQRKGSGYSDSNISEGHFPSASAVRRLVYEGADISGLVPGCVNDSLHNEHLSHSGDWLDILKYAVMSSSVSDIEECPSAGEGLGNLLKKCIKSAETWDGLIMDMKSRRYTYTRLSRLCMQMILGIRRTDYVSETPEYIRVLGAGPGGRKLLADIRDKGSAGIPVLTNINKEAEDLIEKSRMLQLDIHASDIYNLVTGRDLELCSDRRVRPVII